MLSNRAEDFLFLPIFSLFLWAIWYGLLAWHQKTIDHAIVLLIFFLSRLAAMFLTIRVHVLCVLHNCDNVCNVKAFELLHKHSFYLLISMVVNRLKLQM